MKNGIYGIRLNTTEKQVSGTVIIENNIVQGGDMGFVYSGKISIDGEKIIGSINIKRWNENIESLIPGVYEYKLSLNGSTGKDYSFNAIAKIDKFPEVIVGVLGSKIQDIQK